MEAFVLFLYVILFGIAGWFAWAWCIRPFTPAYQQAQRIAGEERKQWLADERTKIKAKQPIDPHKTKFREHIQGAPQPIIDIFLEAEEACMPYREGDEFDLETIITVVSGLKDGSLKTKLQAEKKELPQLYAALTLAFDAINAIIPPPASGGMTISLASIDGALIANTLRVAMHGNSMCDPILSHLVNNQMIYDAQVQKKTDSKDPYTISKLLLSGTPFAKLPDLRLPIEIPDKIWSEHCFILGPPGTGKTQLIQYLVSEDLKAVAEGERSVLVMDSQSDLINGIKNLQIFAPGQPLAGKLIILDPDVDFPLALNIFDMGKARLSSYSSRDREQLNNSTLELITYVLGALGDGAELTPKQATLYRYCIKLCLMIEGATLHTFVEILNSGVVKYKKYVDQLDDTSRQFFAIQFPDPKQFGQTKQEVAWRLMLMLENNVFNRMFSYPKSKFDLFEELNEPKVILINTDKALLGEERTGLLGRFFIALLIAASNERATLARGSRLPVRCYIDECHEYIARDPKITYIFDQARKMNVGSVCATQRCAKITNSNVLDALLTASIKFARTDNDSDANTLSRNMNTTAQVIAKQPPKSFALSVRGLTDQALSVAVPYLVMEKMEKMSHADRDRVAQAMRDRYTGPAAQAPPEPEPAPRPRPSPPPSPAAQAVYEEDLAPNEEFILEVNDTVQWTVSGTAQFSYPRTITGFSRDGKQAFIDHSPVGIPTSQLTLWQLTPSLNAPPRKTRRKKIKEGPYNINTQPGKWR